MEVWELKLYFYPSAGGLKKKKKKRQPQKVLKRVTTVQATYCTSNRKQKIQIGPDWISYFEKGYVLK